MAELWWTSTRDAYTGDDQGRGLGDSRAVDEQHPIPFQIMWRESDADEWEPVDGLRGLPVSVIPPGKLKNVTVTAYVASLVVSARPTTLYGFSGYNSGAAQFLLVFDAAALPAEGAVPKLVLAVGATSNFAGDWGVEGRFFSNGIVICNSSTGPTKTIGAADCWLDVQYR